MLCSSKISGVEIVEGLAASFMVRDLGLDFFVATRLTNPIY